LVVGVLVVGVVWYLFEKGRERERGGEREGGR